MDDSCLAVLLNVQRTRSQRDDYKCVSQGRNLKNSTNRANHEHLSISENPENFVVWSRDETPGTVPLDVYNPPWDYSGVTRKGAAEEDLA